MKNMIFAIALITAPVFAETLTDRIHSVVENPNGTAIVRFAGGRVGFITEEQKDLVTSQTGALVRAELDRDSDLKDLTLVQAPMSRESDVNLKNSVFEAPPVFEPTVISRAKVDEIFKKLNSNFKRLSECSDRAHVWASDEFQRSGTKSQKAFILLTASYINRVRFKWWFHVAPMFTVQTPNGIQKYMTDVMYKDRAVTLKEWANMMVFSGRDCKMTTKFSEYDVNPQTEDCYMIHESMYYRLPGDVHNQEISGIYRSEWNESEVNSARSRAFNAGRIQ